MSKNQLDRLTDPRPASAEPSPLSPSIRRHLGRNLRTFYAEVLLEPLSERLGVLLDRLDKPRR